MIYAIDPSSELAAPTTQQDVLNNNAVRFALTDKLVRLPKFTPVPSLEVAVAGTGGAAQSGVSFRPQWLSLDAPGTSVLHNGVTWYYLAASSGGQTNAEVYCKVTFACKDPARAGRRWGTYMWGRLL